MGLLSSSVDWLPQDEIAYQNWMRVPGSKANEWYRGLQNYIDKVDPGGKVDIAPAEYDYRGAFKAGVEPEMYDVDGSYHWGSQFKSADHPTMWMEHFMQDYGADPGRQNISKDDYEFMQKMLPNNKSNIKKLLSGYE